MRTKGKITHWNEEKGYGFITPASGAREVFVHIRAFSNRHKPPELNQAVSFALSTDKQGRPCAVRVTRAGERLPGHGNRSGNFLLVLLAIGFIVFVDWTVSAGHMPVEVLYLYLGVSAFTFLVYAKDKWAARKDRWRTKEKTLHLLALIGGWPGAMIAQQVFRHKSRKDAFRFTFWLTVVFNCGAFAWLFTTEGAEFLQLLSGKIPQYLHF